MSLRFDASIRLGPWSYDAAFEADREIVVLFGESGAGKSVTLQLIAGLLRPDDGEIEAAGRTLFDATRGIDLPPQQRELGYVVQELALFPHLTVAENVAFGLADDVRGDAAARAARVTEQLRRLDIEQYAARMPDTLSGGQRQRVALARALARSSSLLLLDEPFSALDESLRRNLRAELTRLREELDLTVVFVTHDLREAHLLADRLVIFDGGRVLQAGPPAEVFRHPASRRVAALTGVENFFRGVLERGEDSGGARVRLGPVVFELAASVDAAIPDGAEVDVAIRAERVNLRRGEPAALSEPNVVAASIVEEDAYGAGHTLRFALDDAPELRVIVDLPSRPYEVLGVAEQRHWTLELPPADLHVMLVADEGIEAARSVGSS